MKQECECTDECLGYLTKECKRIEEPKQETLEEVAERFYAEEEIGGFDISGYLQSAFLTGVKWQQERSYSEEEVLNLLTHFAVEIQRQNKRGQYPLRIKEWFERNKKK